MKKREKSESEKLKENQRKKFKRVCEILNVETITLPDNINLSMTYLMLIDMVDKYEKAVPHKKLPKKDQIRQNLNSKIREFNKKRTLKARANNQPPRLLKYCNLIETKEEIKRVMAYELFRLKSLLIQNEYNKLYLDYMREKNLYIEKSKLENRAKTVMRIIPELIPLPKIEKIVKVSNRYKGVKDKHKDLENGREIAQLEKIQEFYSKKLLKLKQASYKDLSFTYSLLGLKEPKLKAKMRALKKEADKKVVDRLEEDVKKKELAIKHFTKEIERFLNCQK